MSPSWDGITVALAGVLSPFVVFIQILQPGGSAAECQGLAKMCTATFVSHASHLLNFALFVMVAKGCLYQQDLESYLRKFLLISYSLWDTTWI